MTKIFMTGGQGYLGRYLRTLGVQDLGCDVSIPADVESAVLYNKPDIILHLAGKSNVDYCESRQNENEVIKVNVRGTFNVATAAEKIECGVVLLSSCQVFSGKSWFKYKETSHPGPVNFYGMTKLSAESMRKVFPNLKVVRTSYIFDLGRLANSHGSQLQYPSFMKRSFIHREHFSSLLMRYANRFWDMPALMHLCGSDSVSWADFMQGVLDASGSSLKVERRNHDIESDKVAPRGHNLGLDNSLSKEWGFPSYSYKDGLELL